MTAERETCAPRRKPSRAKLKALLPDAYAAIKKPATFTGEELRALEVMSVVPAGCTAYRDTNGCCNPHVKLGEFAVADTTDREPKVGEIYLLRWMNGTQSVLVLKRDRRGDLWFGSMPGSLLRATSDGPYEDDDYLRSKIVGRVVGVIPEGLAYV